MLHREFLKHHGHHDPEKSRVSLLTINLVLYAGVCIILAGLFFMIMNIDKADGMIHIWRSFLIAGVALVFLSLLIRLNKELHRRDGDQRN